jgi:hypothetical protein
MQAQHNVWEEGDPLGEESLALAVLRLLPDGHTFIPELPFFHHHFPPASTDRLPPARPPSYFSSLTKITRHTTQAFCHEVLLNHTIATMVVGGSTAGRAGRVGRVTSMPSASANFLNATCSHSHTRTRPTA